MKRIIAILSIGMFLTGCDTSTTTVSQDIEMLQTKYPNSVVYKIDSERYIVIDSLHALDIRVNLSGEITSTIRIK
jgi:PBP1b-binding outer membrane lipoprotein LpoB